MFRTCVKSVNLQHFNRNEVLADDFIQFTIEHTDFVDYVFSSCDIKYSDLHYATLVDGLKNWLSNLAQSNRQMNMDNDDWAILLHISRTSEVPRGFGKKKKGFGLQSKVKLNIRESEGVNPPVFDPDFVMDVQVLEQGSLQRDEERELFGSVSDDDNESSSSSSSSDSGGNEYDNDSGML